MSSSQARAVPAPGANVAGAQAQQSGQALTQTLRAMDDYYRGPTHFPSQMGNYWENAGNAENPRYETAHSGAKWRGPKDDAGGIIDAPLPAKYNMMTAQQQKYLDMKHQLTERLKEKKGAGVVMYGDQDIAAIASKEAEQNLMMFDQYVHGLVDFRKPGMLQWLNSIYPDYVTRRVQQIKDDMEIDFKDKWIKNFGVHSFEDLLFDYKRKRKEIMTAAEREEFISKNNIKDGFQFGLFNPRRGQYDAVFTPAAGTDGSKAEHMLKVPGTWQAYTTNPVLAPEPVLSTDMSTMGIAPNSTPYTHAQFMSAIHRQVGQAQAQPQQQAPVL